MAAAELSAAVLASALGLRTRVTVRELSVDEGGGVAFDLVASRARPRGAHAPHAVGVVALADPSLLEPREHGNALARLAPGGVVAVPSERRAAEALWAEVPPWAKAVVFDRGARVVGWAAPQTAEAAPEDAWVTAAAFVGIALALAAAEPRDLRRRSELGARRLRRRARSRRSAAGGRGVARPGRRCRRRHRRSGRANRLRIDRRSAEGHDRARRRRCPSRKKARAGVSGVNRSYEILTTRRLLRRSA